MKKIFILLAAVVLVFAGCTSETVNDSTQNETVTAQNNNQEESKTIDNDENTQSENEPVDNDKSSAEDKTEETSNNFLDVTMTDIDGNEWNLAKLGEKAVIKVWASWCSICLSGMDEYNSFSKEYKDGKVLTVVTPDMYGEMGKDDFVEWFKSLEGYDDTVVILDEDGVLIKNLGIRGFPTYVYLDSKGNVNSGAIGHQQSADVVARLETIG